MIVNLQVELLLDIVNDPECAASNKCCEYRAMHYSAKRGIAIACCPSVRNVGGSGPHRLEILATNCKDN